MSKITLILLSLIIFQSAQYAWSDSMNPRDIMLKNDDARRVHEFEAQAKLTTGDLAQMSTGTGDKVKDFTLWRKVQSDGIHDSTLTRFHAPAEVRNEGILMIENASGKNDVLLYLPNFKKIRRVESQQQSGSFMGSAFSYSDIAAPHVDDFTYKTLKEEKCPEAEASDQNCAVIECTPANDDVKERTSYSKTVLWVRLDNFMWVAGEYYDLDGILFKKIQARQIKIVDSKNKKWLAHDLTIQNFKIKDFTRLEFSKVKVNGGISDAVFTQQNLQKVN